MAKNSTVAQTMHHQTARSRPAVSNTPATVREEDTWQKTRLAVAWKCVSEQLGKGLRMSPNLSVTVTRRRVRWGWGW